MFNLKAEKLGEYCNLCNTSVVIESFHRGSKQNVDLQSSWGLVCESSYQHILC